MWISLSHDTALSKREILLRMRMRVLCRFYACAIIICAKSIFIRYAAIFATVYSSLVHGIFVRLRAEPVVTYGNKSNRCCYGIDEECCQGDAEAIGETAFMATTIEGEESSKILIQVNIGSKSNSIEQHCMCVCWAWWG